MITGYQDEESPGRRLLDLAEQKKSTLEIGGQQVQVLCHVAKYNLSAHADGGELAAYATALKPKRVALVHGDEEARAALRKRLAELDVLLPSEGMTGEKQERRRSSTPGDREGRPGDREGRDDTSSRSESVCGTLPMASEGGVSIGANNL